MQKKHKKIKKKKFKHSIENTQKLDGDVLSFESELLKNYIKTDLKKKIKLYKTPKLYQIENVDISRKRLNYEINNFYYSKEIKFQKRSYEFAFIEEPKILESYYKMKSIEFQEIEYNIDDLEMIKPLMNFEEYNIYKLLLDNQYNI